MMKYSKAGMVISLILLIALCGCTMSTSNSSDVVNSPLASPTAEIERRSAMSPKESTPAPEAAMPATAPAEDILGIELPAADADGHRTYRWHDQIVEDWLGDFAQANELRSMMLPRLDGTQKDDYYILFLGHPLPVDGGWLLPAGKRTDGEWLPSLYPIAEDAAGFKIKGKAENYAWTLNRTFAQLSDDGYTSFFGILRLVGADSNTRRVRAEATFADGTKALSEIPKGYPYLLLAHLGDSTITDLAYFDAQSGAPLKMLDTIDGYEWAAKKGRQRTGRLNKNIRMAPLFDSASNLFWQEIPQLQRMNASYEENGTVYAADLHDSTHVLRVVAPAPLEQAAMEYDFPMYIGSTRQVLFDIEGKAWGTPQAVRAMLYLPNGTTRELPLKDNEIDTGKLARNNRYLLHVHADFGASGWIEWVVHLDK